MKKDRQYYTEKVNEAIAFQPKPKGFDLNFIFSMKARLDFKQELTKAQFKALDNVFAYLFHGCIDFDYNNGEFSDLDLIDWEMPNGD